MVEQVWRITGCMELRMKYDLFHRCSTMVDNIEEYELHDSSDNS